jgi:short-subunit dehydrogenase
MHAFITGASSGIGEGLARALAGAGYDVTLVARRAAELERVRASLGADARAQCLPADLAELDGLVALLDKAEAGLGPIDVLVQNAGMQIVAPTVEVGVADAENMFTVNVLAPFRILAHMLPKMIARGRGTIVDIASLSALVGPPGMYHYAASKAALAAGSESLRAEVKPHGVHVVTVYPGVIKTDMSAAALTKYTEEPPAMPTGTVEGLARLVVRAIEQKRARVIYPRFYALSRHFPAVARLVTDAFAPPLKKAGE